MNGHEKILFWLYKKKHKAVKITKRYHGSGPPMRLSLQKSTGSKADPHWELANLYYEGVHDASVQDLGAKKREESKKL